MAVLGSCRIYTSKRGQGLRHRYSFMWSLSYTQCPFSKIMTFTNTVLAVMPTKAASAIIALTKRIDSTVLLPHKDLSFDEIDYDSSCLETVMLQMIGVTKASLVAETGRWSAEVAHFVEATSSETPEQLTYVSLASCSSTSAATKAL